MPKYWYSIELTYQKNCTRLILIKIIKLHYSLDETDQRERVGLGGGLDLKQYNIRTNINFRCSIFIHVVRVYFPEKPIALYLYWKFCVNQTFMLPKSIAITHVSDVLFYLLNIYFVYIHTNFLKYISTVIKFYFRLHRWISLYHLMYVYIAWQNGLQSNTHIVF